MEERHTAGVRSGRTRPNLTEKTVERLRARLAGGELRPGDRLPTEQALVREYGVSRTVVREAIAALRADGLVVPRQGAGVFVTKPPEQPFGLSLFAFEPDKLSSIIEMLELRAAVESEAAALAAERCSPAELAKIREQFEAITAAFEAGEWGEDQDFRFHLAIAEATHNRHFIEFFRFLGQRTIPRAQWRGQRVDPARAAGYRDRIQAEHREIATAIARGDAAAAHASMRAHLKGSQERYQGLMDER